MKLNLLAFALAFLFVLGTPAASFSQEHHKKTSGEKPASKMSMMMEGPHHKMGMAYRKNMNTLASALADVAAGDDQLNGELIRSMVSDLKGAFEMLTNIHRDHMTNMKPEMMAEMAPMMEKMKSKMKELSDHIAALEASVSNDRIDKKQLGSHATAIAKLTGHGDMKMGDKEKMKMGDGMKGSETANR
ncbi:MAG: hypothetical protein J5I65_11790 [Aridibacter famidurans]|nr:hypothetical protein [Aridibacter famidurans]